MPIFHYSALNRQGSLEKSELTAADRKEVIRMLEKKHLKPLEIINAANGAMKKTDAGKKEIATDKSGKIKLKRTDVVLFTEELSDLLGAGLQLEPALRIMENREEVSALKEVTRRIRQQVRDGNSFSKALQAASSNFGPLYCNLAAAGEVSGALPAILKRQAEYLKTLQELQSKVILALIYPAFLLVAGFAVVLLFLTYLLPQLTNLLEESGVKLPLGARILQNISDFIGSWWWLFVIIFGIAFFIGRLFLREEENRAKWDEKKLRIPFVGRVLSARFYVQFLETLSNLVANGLPLLRGLELSQGTTQNLYLKSLLRKMVEQVGDGSALSRCMKRIGFFPPLLIDIVSVGEQTGDTEGSLARAAERYDKELENNIQRLSAMIQPIIVFVMALLIGTMAFLMITAITQSMSGLQGAR